jgi:RNA polymerase sigma factor (sigma-70 family)
MIAPVLLVNPPAFPDTMDDRFSPNGLNLESEGFPSGCESTSELVRRVHRGDRQALDRLCELYLPSLRRWATGRLPRWARDLLDTDDLVQDTVFKTLQRIEAFEPRREGAFQAYLRQALLNRIRDEVRRVRRKPPSAESPEETASPDASPLEKAIGGEAFERYEAALRRLPDEDQAAIMARIEMGFSYAELAASLGKPTTDAARMAVSRALMRLAKEMSRES